MRTAMGYGDWFNDKPASTGSSFDTSKVAHLFVATILATGTGGIIDFHSLEQYQSGNSSPSNILKIPAIESEPSTNPVEYIQRIREIFSPAISDLAKSLNVSRQAVYNWLNGEMPKEKHLAKLQDLAQSAEMIAQAGISMTGSLMKRKIVNGHNLLEVSQSGGSVLDAVQALIHIVRRENKQRERMKSRFANRANSSHSVESDFPATNDMS